MKSGVDIASEETFGHFAQVWYDVYKKPYLREKSQNITKYVVNQYILPLLGNCVPREITPMQIQAVMANMADKSNSLQSKVLIALRDIFRAAVENGLVAKTPVSDRLKAGGKTAEEKVTLTPNEEAALLDAVENLRAKTFLLLCLRTGARRGEALALRYEDIDFDAKVVHIRRNAIVKEQETKAGRRNVPLPEDLEAWLTEHGPKDKTGYIFSTRNGKPLTLSAFRSMFRLIARELPEKLDVLTPDGFVFVSTRTIQMRTYSGFRASYRHFLKRNGFENDGLNLHRYRHTYASMLLEQEVNPKVVQKLLGHRDVSTTLGIYTHVVPEVFSAVTAAVNEATNQLMAGNYAPKRNAAQIRQQLQQLDPLLSDDIEINLKFA